MFSVRGVGGPIGRGGRSFGPGLNGWLAWETGFGARAVLGVRAAGGTGEPGLRLKREGAPASQGGSRLFYRVLPGTVRPPPVRAFTAGQGGQAARARLLPHRSAG